MGSTNMPLGYTIKNRIDSYLENVVLLVNEMAIQILITYFSSLFQVGTNFKQ